MIVTMVFGLAVTCAFAAPAEMSVAGDWQVKVSVDGASSTLTVQPAEQVSVVNEKIGALPLFNPKGAEYARGYKLAGVRAKEGRGGAGRGNCE